MQKLKARFHNEHSILISARIITFWGMIAKLGVTIIVGNFILGDIFGVTIPPRNYGDSYDIMVTVKLAVTILP